MNWFQRIAMAFRCWRYNVPFVSDTKTGEGFAVESYNPFTDTFHVRLSRFGYVEGHYDPKSADFLAFASPLDVEFDAFMRLTTGRPPGRSGR